MGVSPSYFSDKEVHKIAYSKWKNMICRCYSPNDLNYKRYGAKGINVDPSWHSYHNFYNDIPSLKGYERDLFVSSKLELDKDYLQNGIECKVYSKETCVLLPTSINHGLISPCTNKTIIGISPEGERFEFCNIAEFAREHNLTAPNIHLAIQEGVFHKGWNFTRIEIPFYKVQGGQDAI